MKKLLLEHDKKLLKNCRGIVGLDEVGRGALAGPVVAAAAWLSRDFYRKASRLKGVDLINDSKLLQAEKRKKIFQIIEEWQLRGLVRFFSAEGSVQEIEEHNILGATRLAMKRALERVVEMIPEDCRITKISELPLWDSLNHKDEETQSKILVDGLPLKPFEYRHQSIIGGDALSLAIAIASIVAKIFRDQKMVALSKEYPGYGFELHKGYGTEFHRQAITQRGSVQIHRTLFLRNLLGENVQEKEDPLP